MKIKEAPGFLLIGLLISGFFLLANLILYLRDFSFRGWANQYLPSSLIFFLIALYFVYNLKKAMEESHDKDRRG